MASHYFWDGTEPVPPPTCLRRPKSPFRSDKYSSREINVRPGEISLRLGPISGRLASISLHPRPINCRHRPKKLLPIPARFCFTAPDLLKNNPLTPHLFFVRKRPSNPMSTPDSTSRSGARSSLKDQCAQVSRRRRKLQLALDAEYPPANAAFRKQIGLQGNKAMS